MLVYSKRRAYAINLLADNFWLITKRQRNNYSSLEFVVYINGEESSRMTLQGFGRKDTENLAYNQGKAAEALLSRIINSFKVGNKEFDIEREAKAIASATENVSLE
ncbi:MAG: hypothetical protein AAB965_03045 [Patescibacteria group bacterium]